MESEYPKINLHNCRHHIFDRVQKFIKTVSSTNVTKQTQFMLNTLNKSQVQMDQRSQPRTRYTETDRR